MYKSIIGFIEKFIEKKTFFKYGFNLSPAYRRTTGRVYFVSDDLRTVKVKIPLSYKNSNYMGTMFGGAMASATDPIFMIQLIKILGNKYVVWDKSGSIKFKRPGKQTLYAEFNISKEFIEQVKMDIELHKKMHYVLSTHLTDKSGNICAEIERVVYIASKAHYKETQNARKEVLVTST